ncbi:YdaS family helix-turn-helix protein [Hahella sp. NBU794]|uniref:YdaS family helix-turn-helix protein n=1 Tax=Hahella sp. NBU794 TaxID=3422590 RepID=UPI003D6EA889
MTALLKAIDIVGGQAVLARSIGVKQAYVWNWAKRRQQTPAKYIRAVSEATKGAVTLEELLSDHEKDEKPLSVSATNKAYRSQGLM